MHHCNILLNVQVVDPPVQSGESPTQIPVSQDVQPVGVLNEPEWIETMVSKTLGVGATPKIPKITPSKETSSRQIGAKLSLTGQQQKWAAVLVAVQNIVTWQTN